MTFPYSAAVQANKSALLEDVTEEPAVSSPVQAARDNKTPQKIADKIRDIKPPKFCPPNTPCRKLENFSDSLPEEFL
jgi:hypothetical protein